MRRDAVRKSSQALIGLALCCNAATAGSFAVSPIKAELTAQRAVTSLTVRNDGSESVSIQLQTNAWSQQDGVDVQTPTTDLIASPPIFSLDPGASQVVRVGLRKPQAGSLETTYRLLLQELPPPPTPDFQGLKVALALSVPVFIAPATPAQERLNWQIRDVDGGLQVQLHNQGNVHARITEFTLSLADGSPVARMDAASYVLAGQTGEWTLTPTSPVASGTRLRLSARTMAGPRGVELDLP
jgi:fimbrial chaperone protein